MGRTNETAMVYVVDDEPAVRRSLEVLLRSVRLGVESFASGREFLAASVKRPACLVLDIRMPGMDGFELQHQLAGTDHDLPFVVITGDGDEETRRRSLELGAVSFLHKPYDVEELLQAIHCALDRSSTP